MAIIRVISVSKVTGDIQDRSKTQRPGTWLKNRKLLVVPPHLAQSDQGPVNKVMKPSSSSQIFKFVLEYKQFHGTKSQVDANTPSRIRILIQILYNNTPAERH